MIDKLLKEKCSINGRETRCVIQSEIENDACKFYMSESEDVLRGDQILTNDYIFIAKEIKEYSGFGDKIKVVLAYLQ